MKKKHKNNENSEEESEEDEPMIKVEENRVYFNTMPEDRSLVEIAYYYQ